MSDPAPPPPAPETVRAAAIARTRAWVEHAVVGLGLCPFAKAPMAKAQIRYAVCAAADEAALLQALCDELQLLAQADPALHETTLLIHPEVLRDFDAYNDFLDIADAALQELGLEGLLQIASFHPDYRFAGTAPGDLGNATNRSPHPMLHLLREDSIARAVAAFPDPAEIVEANQRTLAALGASGWAALQARCEAQAAAELACTPARAPASTPAVAPEPTPAAAPPTPTP